ncbi:bifunctional DNA primase/polymerase [Amycolatopsis sp. NPDC047767]|uniref:bifunctional DNA primase/polymerase n=1 Tax=Amycolatopsis sp. NPDC047767 TaxID=3156765 RepID=UPI0034544E18
MKVALDSANNRWAVFPLYPLSKRPAVENWENWATTDHAKIRAWWSDHPRDNVGVACGPSDLLVIDLDAGRGPVPEPWRSRGIDHGRDVLAALCARAGQPDPAHTLITRTPNSGEHRYFHQPGGLRLRSTVGRRRSGLGWSIDTRGHGGLVVAPGSRLRRGGRLAPYEVARDLPPAPLPLWLAQRLTPAPPRLSAPGQQPPTPRRISAYVEAAVAGETSEVRSAGVGERHIAVFAAAAALGELAEKGWISDAAITNAIVDAGRRHVGVEGFTWRELTTAIRDGISAGRRSPREIPEQRVV